MQDGHLTFTIPDSAFTQLEEGLHIANEAESPSDNAKRRCFGWLQMLGPALTRTAERRVVDQVANMARQAGFRIVTHRDLLTVTASARQSRYRVLGDARWCLMTCL